MVGALPGYLAIVCTSSSLLVPCSPKWIALLGLNNRGWDVLNTQAEIEDRKERESAFPREREIGVLSEKEKCSHVLWLWDFSDRKIPVVDKFLVAR